MASEVTEVRQLLASVAGDEIVDSIKDDDRFFEDRIIDSLHLMAIVDEFQSRFGIEVAGNELSPENFGSIAGMSRFLSSKRDTAGSRR